ncbi:MAG: DUF6382 domain-containing protein [Acetatifactor sp.]
MLQTEFIRSLHCNYERVLLDRKPEEKRYQYCILSRGGIKGLLSCSLRYLNGLAYLYYDITSKQSIKQLYDKRCITAEWLKDFMWSVRQIQAELGRFLLNDQNIIWFPEQIFQDLERNIFFFLYIPYYEGEGGFLKLLTFLVEHINYEDEMLVECVYKMYEQYERSGEAYLHSQIFEDIKLLDKEAETGTDAVEKAAVHEMEEAETVERSEQFVQKKKEKKSFLSLLGDRRRQDKEARDNYRENLQRAMAGYAVAEEADYEPLEYGRTVCMEEKEESKTVHRYRLFTQEGRLLTWINTSAIILGKKREEVDICLEDISVSRIHARIVKEEEKVYIEDLNSTNGTLINGQRLQPYEKRKLEEGDEIKCGKTVLIFR